MIKPIDMQGVVKNIDHVARINKIHEQSLAGQQDNAKMQQEKNIKKDMNSVVHTSETEKKLINKDGKREHDSDEEKRRREEDDEESEKHDKKSVEPEKGNFLDIEG
jgi:hypothetical protein